MPIRRSSDLSYELQLSERRRNETQRLSGVGFWELNHQTGDLYWSEEIFAVYDLEPNVIQPDFELFLSLIYDADKDFVSRAYQESVESGNQYDIQYRIKAGTSVKWIEARGVTYYDKAGKPERSIGTATDISEIVTAQQKITHMAYHDVLTGLANRKLFSDELSDHLLLAAQQGANLAVLFIDLDDFKSINDRYGHDIGDQVLVGVAQKLSLFDGCANLFARIGGDEFVGFLYDVDDANLESLVNLVKATVDGVYDTSAQSFKIAASIGVTLYPQDSEEPDTLLRHADQAMYEAKEQGKSGIRYFDTERFQSIWSRRNLLNEIEVALANDDFELFYQPRVRLKDNTIAGSEALLRWFRPEGAIAPNVIIEAIKNTALEWALDKWVINHVLLHSKDFRAHGLSGPFSLNINATTLQNADFPSLLESLLAKQQVTGDQFEIEVLEVESIRNINAARDIINQCKQLGVSFALDDFGTGYSSLSYFHALPVSTLKVDQRFIKSVHSNPESLSLVKSILAIADMNNRVVVAEGVETDAIAEMLAQLNCEFGQGFGIARPMSLNSYIEWAKNRMESERQSR